MNQKSEKPKDTFRVGHASSVPRTRPAACATRDTSDSLSRRDFLRQTLALGAGLGAASLLNACGPAVSPQPAPTTAPAAIKPATFDWKRFDGRKIRILLWEHPEANEWKRLLPEFESQTGIRVQWEQASVADIYTKTILELTQAPDKLDIFAIVPPQHALKFTRDGFMADLKPFLEDKSLTSPDYDYEDHLPGVAKSLVFDGGKLLGGIPAYINTQVVTYRKDLYQQKGLKPPETFEDLLKNAAALHDPANELYGVVLRGIGPQAVWHYSAWLWGYGGDWLDKNGRAAVNTPEAVQAMKVYGDTLGKSGPPGPTDLDDARMIATFMAGKAAHHYSHPVYSKDFNDPTKSKAAGKLGWTLVPAGPKGRFTESVGVGISLSAKSPNKEPAWMFMQWATSKKMMINMQSKVSIFTGRKSAWDSSEFAEDVKKNGLEEWRDVVVKALANGRGDPLPPVEDVAAARDAIGAAIVTAIKGGDVKAAADEANAKYQKLLGG